MAPLQPIMQVLLGNGDGTFAQGQTYNLSAGEFPTSVIAGDFNGDGKLDLAVSEAYCGGGCASGDILIFLGNGDGTFQSPALYDFNGIPRSTLIADFNGDGNIDLLAVTQGTYAPIMYILYGNGDGTFRASQLSMANSNMDLASALGDFNGDGRLDVIATAARPPGVLYLLPQVPPPQIPAVRLSPKSLIFGPQTIGTTSPPQTVTLTNTGTATLTISSITIIGANPGDYAQTNNCGTSVPINASCQINVTFTPTAPGARDAAVNIVDNAPDSPQSVSLAGNLPLAVVLSPDSLTFPNQAIGTTSPPQTVVLTNLGQQTLTISSIAITGANASDYVQTNNCGTTVPSNVSCQINVTFTPTASGARTAAVEVTDNAPGSPQTVPLMGNLPTATVSLSPLKVVFPNQYVGTGGLPQNVTLTNTGTVTLTISSVTATPADFGVTSACGKTVAGGTNCKIGVSFDPTVGGTRIGTLTITDNASDSPQTVSLTGTGQDFSMAPKPPSSATVSPGQTASYTVLVTPVGQFNQTVMLTCSGAPAGSTCSVPSSVTLNGSAPTPVNVTVKTVAASASLVQPGSFWAVASGLAMWLGGLPGLVILGTSGRGRRNRRGGLLYVVAFLCLLSIGITLSGCGGGSGNGSGSGGTPTGTYKLTVTGTFTSGANMLTHNTNLTLVVQ
jgi:hypothetical protein